MDLLMYGVIFVSAILIGIFAVVMGGTLFLSLPLFQILFPEMSLAAIIANIKFGSVFRNVGALRPLYHKLSIGCLWLAPLLCFGSLIGSWQVLSFSEAAVPIVLVAGLIANEFGEKLSLPKPLLAVAALAIGVYGGIFGAGIMLLILSLLKLNQKDTVDARANALLLEMILSAVAVAFFWYSNLINWPIALTWTAGGILGGVLGGYIIKHTGRWPKPLQNWLVRIAFLIALMVSIWKIV